MTAGRNRERGAATDQSRRDSPVYGMTDAQICDHWWRRAQWEEAEYQRRVAEAAAGETESEAP